MDATDFINRISLALGRKQVPATIPAPPELDETIVRLRGQQEDLVEEYVRSSTGAGMEARQLPLADVAMAVAEDLVAMGCKSAVLPDSDILSRLGIASALERAGISVKLWSQISADDAFEADCGVTDVRWAIAETGSLVVGSSPTHGRMLSLAPPVHVAIVQPGQIVPDLLDVMRLLQVHGAGSGTTLITGPSKTSDIEGNLVIGVHGPGVVKVFVADARR